MKLKATLENKAQNKKQKVCERWEKVAQNKQNKISRGFVVPASVYIWLSKRGGRNKISYLQDSL